MDDTICRGEKRYKLNKTRKRTRMLYEFIAFMMSLSEVGHNKYLFKFNRKFGEGRA